MPGPLAIAFAVSSLVSAGTGVFNALKSGGGGNFDVTERINKLFDQRLSTGLEQIAGGSARRLGGAGLEGSGVINQIILDNQQRFRSQLEQQRESSLIEAEGLKLQNDIFNQQQQQGALGGLAELGLNLFDSFSQTGQNQNIENPFSGIVDNSLRRNQSVGFGEPQSIQPRPPNTSDSGNLGVQSPLEFVSNTQF